MQISSRILQDLAWRIIVCHALKYKLRASKIDQQKEVHKGVKQNNVPRFCVKTLTCT